MRILQVDVATDPHRGSKNLDRSESPHWHIVLGAGIALAVIGWTDALLLWYPLDFGNLDWEFATLTGSFDALPLGTIGLIGMLVGTVAGARYRGIVLLSFAFGLLSALLALLFALYGLTILSVWTSIEEQFRSAISRAVVKTSVLAVTYILLYGWLSWTARRTAMALRKTK